MLSPLPLFHTLRLNGMPHLHRCEPGWRWSPPPLPDYDLWYVMAGEGEMILFGRRHVLQPGVCFVLPPGCRPSATQNIERRLHVFAGHFDPLAEDGSVLAPEALGMPPQGRMVGDRAYLDTLAYRCADCVAQGGALGVRQAFLLVEQILLYIWEEAERPVQDPADRRLREIAAAIRDAPGEDWSVETQAARACLSRSQYTRRFTRLFGMSPTRFVIDARLARAAQLLRETEMTAGEIASALGYRDLFFFSRQFKAYRGLTPSAERASGPRPSAP